MNNYNQIGYSTRYRGSKLKLIEWIWSQIKDLQFNTFLDVMGGTGTVAYKAKLEGKSVTFNDKLKHNYTTGIALIENNNVILTQNDINFITKKHPNIDYPDFIQKTFKNIYFTDDENEWIDHVITNINHLDNRYKRALALHSLFQSCIAKRPYNLFHRKNLYIRFKDVNRSFGNKKTWDKSFDTHFNKIVNEVNRCIFSNGQPCYAMNLDAFNIPDPEKYDMVYIDPPYIPKNGEILDYRDSYHFLEGLTFYDTWYKHINHNRKHKPLYKNYNIWNDKNLIHNAFDKLFEKYQKSIIVVSYRNDGIPTETEIKQLLKKHKKNVISVNSKDYKYVLSKKKSQELLFIAY